MPLAGRPFLTFMLDWLHAPRRGRGDPLVRLHVGRREARARRHLRRHALRYVIEDEPLGTAGPVRLAYDEGLLEERLFVLNGDVLTDIDLTAELRAARAHGRARDARALSRWRTRRATAWCPRTTTAPSRSSSRRATASAPTNRINAGAYVIERDVVETSIPAGRAVSFEREVFPALVGDGLYGFDADGYWIDIGTPERYLEATWDLLAGRVASTLPPRDETGSLVYENCLAGGRARRARRACSGATARWAPTRAWSASVLHDRVHVGADAAVVETRARPSACAWASGRGSGPRRDGRGAAR